MEDFACGTYKTYALYLRMYVCMYVAGHVLGFFFLQIGVFFTV